MAAQTTKYTPLSDNGTVPAKSVGSHKIKLLEAAMADDDSLVQGLTRLINKVYSDAEEGIFKPPHIRMTHEELVRLIRLDSIAVAYLPVRAEQHLAEGNGESSLVKMADGRVIGCINVGRPSSDMGSFGLLALQEEYRGGGLGRDLVEFAEEHSRSMGCVKMQLDLLVPTLFEHAFKTRLQSWYGRLGYKLVDVGDFATEYPRIAAKLAGPVEYRIYQKPLV